MILIELTKITVNSADVKINADSSRGSGKIKPLPALILTSAPNHFEDFHEMVLDIMSVVLREKNPKI